jgi:hypothetical protein
MFPCFLAIHQRTSTKPVVIVSTEYAGVFDGISYAEPYKLREHWWQGVPKARHIAETVFGNGIVPQWWNDDPTHIRMINEATQGNFVLQCHGHDWGVDVSKWPDYGTSMASRCGFTREEWLQLPLVFDRRDANREEALAKMVLANETRPVVLYNFVGNSSPFQFAPEVINTMRNQFGRRFRFIDLAPIRGQRIYDLLGLYDRAVGLLTSDTATLHLAPASRIPYISFTVDSWSTSVPKGNCVLHVKYNSTPRRLPEVMQAIASWSPTLK